MKMGNNSVCDVKVDNNIMDLNAFKEKWKKSILSEQKRKENLLEHTSFIMDLSETEMKNLKNEKGVISVTLNSRVII